MFDSLLETMRALMDPMVLFEEPRTHIRDAHAGDSRDPVAGDRPADLAVSRRPCQRACRPGVLSVHVLPADHHDGPGTHHRAAR